jgi:large subunit ribosomal protein L6
MSRIGRRPIQVPSGVSVEHAGGSVRVKGPKGVLEKAVPTGISVEVGGGRVSFARDDDRGPVRARHGLARALVANMVKGVTEGFSRQLQIVGVGYRAEVSGGHLRLTVGYSHPVEMPVPAGLKVSVEKNTELRIEGIDKEAVGQFAANVRGVRPPEPYKGKGIRYVEERVRRKVGKAGATAGGTAGR